MGRLQLRRAIGDFRFNACRPTGQYQQETAEKAHSDREDGRSNGDVGTEMEAEIDLGEGGEVHCGERDRAEQGG